MNLATFLAHAVKLEWEAQKHYQNLAEVMQELHSHEVAAFFHEMVGFSTRHFHEAMQRAGFSDISELPDIDYQWPAEMAPEVLSGNIVDLDRAMQLSLEAERRGADFYAGIAARSTDPEVRHIASTFAAEEREHEQALLRFIGVQPY